MKRMNHTVAHNASNPATRYTGSPLHHQAGTIRNRLHSIMLQNLGASIHQVVELPRDEPCAAWVAAHVIDFYNDLCLIWLVISADPYISTFKAGEGFPSGVEYRWARSESVSAPQYVNLALDWISLQLNDPKWFPADEVSELKVYSTNEFATLCGQIVRRLLRAYGIIYSSFFQTVNTLELAPHLNNCFKHFIYFCVEFALLPDRDLEPLDVLVRPLQKYYISGKRKN